MKFNLFIYATVGRRNELAAGMAGKDAQRYRRMLGEIAELAQLADDSGYFGIGHPEHHLQIEGFEAANDPCLMAMWLGQHSERLRIIPCGFVATAHNPRKKSPPWTACWAAASEWAWCAATRPAGWSISRSAPS